MDPCHAQWATFLDRTWAGDEIHRVLDLCCGSGLMTRELIARDLDVTGLDASEAMLARARALLGPDVPLVHAWLPDLPVEGPFDAVVSTMDGLCYLDLDDFRAALRAIAGSLRPGGWLVFDVHAEAILDFMRRHNVITGDGFVLTTDVDDATHACATIITTPAFTERHVQFVHSTEEIRAALHDAGFEHVRVTDEYTDEPIGDHTLRATWVARRSAG